VAARIWGIPQESRRTVTSPPTDPVRVAATGGTLLRRYSGLEKLEGPEGRDGVESVVT
jgi:hypothetical protein